MYIRRKVFSVLNVEGEERLFSTTDFELAEERTFSEKEEKEEEKEDKNKRKGVDVKDVNSHRGLGRSILVGGLPGAIAAGLTKDDVNKAYKEGMSDEEIVELAGKKGAKKGAIAGALISTTAAPYIARLAKVNPKLAVATGLGTVAGNASLGAAGAYLGARKNAKTRLQKKRLLDAGIEK